MESQIDNFEAEVEGLSVKKGKTRPPRLVCSEGNISCFSVIEHYYLVSVCFVTFLGLFYTSFGHLLYLFQTHLETSISRHRAHIIKLELILRLLDNDELSPDQVNDVKDFLEDYVERNQVCLCQFCSRMKSHLQLINSCKIDILGLIL